ncbi:MAG: hypothetical protein HY680_02270 [Chloroflexi bacterium]|nr:hypothetical protein [Chloroflexota bacterium]
MKTPRLNAALRRGWWVALALAVLTAVDYYIPALIPHGNVPYLALLAVAEAAIIANSFMHVTNLWRRHDQEE